MSPQILSMDGAFQSLGKHDPRRATVEQNAKNFPFLQLSLELRCQIYREVLGDRFIHLKSLRDTSQSIIGLMEGNLHWMDFMYRAEIPRSFEAGDGWLQYVCNKDGPYSKEELMYLGMEYGQREFIWATPGIHCTGHSARPHCHTGAYPPGIPARFHSGAKLPEGDEVYDREMHLGLLRVSRQIYNEANPILWGTNTFSFDTIRSCQHFFDGRTNLQLAGLRSLFLAVDLHQMDKSWRQAISDSLISSLSGLVDLHIFVKDLMDIELYEEMKSGGVHLFDMYFEILVRLSQSPRPRLQRLDLYMGPDFWYDICRSWCRNDKDEYAKILRKSLLTKQL